ncbi:MAG: insulinase family protein [Candidatus Cloacimonetes bacterium]|nr:insulinase family protein [Candidatus Cloacimonadota bacterium]
MIEIGQSVLSNGLRVIHAPMRSHPVLSAQLYIRMGSCWESTDQAGWSHFIEHLVFKATRAWPNNSLTEAAARMGGHLNAFTEHDSTCFTITLPSEFMSDGLALLAELTCHSTFGRQDFDFERKVVIEEIKQYRNDPEDWFYEQIPQLYYRRNPLRLPIAGDEASLLAATWEQLTGFYRTWFVPDNAFLVVTGDASVEQIVQQAEVAFGGWRGTASAKPHVEPEPWRTAGGFHHLRRKLDNPLLAFCLPEYADAHPDAHAQSLLSRVFAGGKNSRLHERLYHVEHLIDGSRISSLSGLHDGIGIVLLFPRRGADPVRIFDIVRQEMERFQRFGPKPTEVERQKTEMLHGHRYAQEYTESLAFSLGSEEVSGDWRNFQRFPEQTRSIDKAQLERLAARHFDPAALHLFHLGARKLEYNSHKPRADAVSRRACRGEGDYCEGVLSCGMRVCLKRAPDRPTIGVALATRVSQLNETTDRGINQLAGTLLLYGTRQRNHHQILADCARHGMALSVASRLECSLIRCKCFELEPAVELIAEMLNVPTFPEEHLQNIKKTTASIIDRIKDKPAAHASALWNRMMFGRGSQYLDRYGTKTSLHKLSRAKVQRWFRQWYRPDNMVLSIVGDIDFDRVTGLLESAFSIPGADTVLPPAAPLLTPSKRHLHTRRSGMDQSILHVGGFAAGGLEAERTTALYVLAHILGGDLHSRLYAALRERLGAAYSVGFDYRATRSRGWFAASAIVDAAAESESLAEIGRQLAACRQGRITPRELETAQMAIRGERLLDEESVSHQAQIIAMLVALDYGYDYYLSRDDRLRAVTLDMLREESQRWFTPDNLYTHVYC